MHHSLTARSAGRTRLAFILVLSAVVLVLAIVGYKYWLTSVARDYVNSFVERINAEGPLKVSYADITASLEGTITVDGIIGKTGEKTTEFEISRITLYRYDARHEPSHYLKMDVNGVRIPMGYPANMEGGSMSAFRQALVVNDELVFDSSMDYDYDQDTQTLALKNFDMRFQPGGTLAFSFIVSDFDITMKDAMDILGPKGMNSKLHRYEMNIVSQGIVQKMLDLYAKDQGLTVEDAVAKLSTDIRATAMEGEPERVTENREQIIKFLENPGRITTVIEPPAPITFAEMVNTAQTKGVEDIAETLNISVTAAPPEE